jgi:hypothetical protein
MLDELAEANYIELQNGKAYPIGSFREITSK